MPQYLFNRVHRTIGEKEKNVRNEMKNLSYCLAKPVLVSGQFGGTKGIMNITPPATTQTTNIPAPIKAPTASFAVVGSVEENL